MTDQPLLVVPLDVRSAKLSQITCIVIGLFFSMAPAGVIVSLFVTHSPLRDPKTPLTDIFGILAWLTVFCFIPLAICVYQWLQLQKMIRLGLPRLSLFEDRFVFETARGTTWGKWKFTGLFERPAGTTAWSIRAPFHGKLADPPTPRRGFLKRLYPAQYLYIDTNFLDVDRRKLLNLLNSRKLGENISTSAIPEAKSLAKDQWDIKFWFVCYVVYAALCIVVHKQHWVNFNIAVAIASPISIGVMVYCFFLYAW